MTTDTLVYLVFGAVLLLALVFDFGLLSKKNKIISIKQALVQTIFWVSLALAFCVFLLVEEGQKPATEFISAYLMEWSLSTDNIFVFILIFNAFAVKEKYYPRVLITGILMAIIFRIVFITVGVTAVHYAEWILYLFGAFLVYTGYKMFLAGGDDEFNPYESRAYRFLKKYLRLTPDDGDGKYITRQNGKKFYTSLFVVVVLLATIDILFAVDSIPAVVGISQSKLVVYTSNIFAVLGLRSLFFLLRGAIGKFEYLPKGIAVVLVFIGIKMLAQYWIDQWLNSEQQSFISLGVILLCLSGSIAFSAMVNRRNKNNK
ncbi:MAG TPA: TerC/Alx family metal homeostasis membrane protein [Chitinophagaceae bacterium]|nr:TerC/Alx family metal homeostasis membrane protein [Chitinophagaceae bacterium]